jgi:hypothetical protein
MYRVVELSRASRVLESISDARKDIILKAQQVNQNPEVKQSLTFRERL